MLGRWDSGDEPDVEEQEDEIPRSNGKAAALRQALRRRDSDDEDRHLLAMKLARSLAEFDPREPEEWEHTDSRLIIYVRRPRQEEAATTAAPSGRTTQAKAATPTKAKSANAKSAKAKSAKAKSAKAKSAKARTLKP